MININFLKSICKIIIVSFIFILLLSNYRISSNSKVFALQSDEVVLNSSIFSEEAEYYQYCLNRLGYKDKNNNILDADGYFGSLSLSALEKFLTVENFAYFSEEAKNKLMFLAEQKITEKYNSGFSLGENKLTPTAFVYSSLSNINNSHDPFYSMSALKEFPYIITMRPDQMSYKSKRVAEVIKANTKIFGYVNLGPNNPTASKDQWQQADLNAVKLEIDSIANSGWYGVFVDQFGYDWNETRERQNIVVDYIHSKGLVCMVNAWFVDDVFGAKVDAITNPNGIESHLNNRDWYLLESFFTDGDSYRGSESYIDKYLKVKTYKEKYKFNVNVLSYKRDSISWEDSKKDIETSYVLAKCLGFEGWWFGKTDNSDNLLYGKEPSFTLGTLSSALSKKSKKMYVAETSDYTIEYYANEIPVLKMMPKGR
jgi:hypothetical protein